ncbi:MAG TPA: hypothetical protein VI112_11230 [Bacteroidia bacterium]
MKKFYILLFVLSCGTLFAQQDSLIGKWQFSELHQKKTDGANAYEKFSAGLPAPKFQYVEFKQDGECVYNEVALDDVGMEYSVKDRHLILGGITYALRFTDKDHLSLTREMYSFKDGDGKTWYVRKEELVFNRLF